MRLEEEEGEEGWAVTISMTCFSSAQVVMAPWPDWRRDFCKASWEESCWMRAARWAAKAGESERASRRESVSESGSEVEYLRVWVSRVEATRGSRGAVGLVVIFGGLNVGEVEKDGNSCVVVSGFCGGGSRLVWFGWVGKFGVDGAALRALKVAKPPLVWFALRLGIA